MKVPTYAVSLAASLFVSSHLFAAQFLIVNKFPDGSFQFVEAESLSVNSSEKVRLLPREATAGQIDPKQISHMTEERPAAFRVIRNMETGLAGRREADGTWQPLTPEYKGAKDRTLTSLELWKESTIAIRKEKAQKTLEGVAFETLYAIVPGPAPAESAAELATHDSWLASPDDALGLIVALVKTYPGSPAAERIRARTEEAMTGCREEWLRGGAARSVLERWVPLAHTAETAFGDDERLKQFSLEAHRQESSLARQAAILNALDAGGRTDDFLLRYLAFEPFRHFADSLAESRERNYRLSAKSHYQEGMRLVAGKDYAGGLRELRLASRRDSSLKEAIQAIDEARLEIARRSAAVAAERLKNLDRRSTQQVQLQRHLLLAEQYLKDGKQTESRKEIEAAQAIDNRIAGVVLAQARLLEAQGELGNALLAMDRYAEAAATDQEFADGEKYRGGLSYAVQREKVRLLNLLAEQYAAGKFSSALQTAAAGLKLDAEEPEFLYHAGIDACILRRCEQAGIPLRRFLEVSDGLGADANRRTIALRLLQPRPATPAPALASAVYDPVSLAFQPKVSDIRASRKVTVNYQWKGASLQAVHARSEDSQDAGHATSDFYFEYAPDPPLMVRVTREPTPAPGGPAEIPIVIPALDSQSYTTEPDARRDASQGYLTPGNSPHIDTALASELTGKRVAVGFSGNRFFHPFAWDGIHLFEMDYDGQGRVRYAWEIGDKNRGGRLDFEWDGGRLLSVRQHADSDGGEVVYQRTLNYSGDRLASESIQYRDKTSKIEYRYDKKGALLEADCGEDLSLDGRSRKAIFLQ